MALHLLQQLKRTRGRGMSLVELIMAVVLLALAGAMLTMPLRTIGDAAGKNDDIRRAWQLAQECNDYIVGRRRNPAVSPGGYADAALGIAASATVCNALPLNTAPDT